LITKSVVLLCAALLVVPGAVQTTFGQAAPQAFPTPTQAIVLPTATSEAYPGGRDLLELMRKAISARQSVRVNSIALSTWKGHWDLSLAWIDLGITSNTLREDDTFQRVRTNVSPVQIAVERRELLVVRGMAANRKPHGSWSCERLTGVVVIDSLIAFQMKAADVTNLGPENAGGVAVWHIRATGAEVAAWATRSANVDLYISRADDTLVQLALHTVTPLGGVSVSERVTETYRRYGEAIKLRLPRPCRS
jgi:hypothetical protein